MKKILKQILEEEKKRRGQVATPTAGYVPAHTSGWRQWPVEGWHLARDTLALPSEQLRPAFEHLDQRITDIELQSVPQIDANEYNSKISKLKDEIGTLSNSISQSQQESRQELANAEEQRRLEREQNAALQRALFNIDDKKKANKKAAPRSVRGINFSWSTKSEPKKIAGDKINVANFPETNSEQSFLKNQHKFLLSELQRVIKEDDNLINDFLNSEFEEAELLKQNRQRLEAELYDKRDSLTVKDIGTSSWHLTREKTQYLWTKTLYSMLQTKKLNARYHASKYLGAQFSGEEDIELNSKFKNEVNGLSNLLKMSDIPNADLFNYKKDLLEKITYNQQARENILNSKMSTVDIDRILFDENSFQFPQKYSQDGDIFQSVKDAINHFYPYYMHDKKLDKNKALLDIATKSLENAEAFHSEITKQFEKVKFKNALVSELTGKQAYNLAHAEVGNVEKKVNLMMGTPQYRTKMNFASNRPAERPDVDVMSNYLVRAVSR